jgi:hypothetical protein
LQVVDLVQTLDGGRRNMYDPDEIEEEQREREKRNKINADFKQFTTRVQVRGYVCANTDTQCHCLVRLLTQLENGTDSFSCVSGLLDAVIVLFEPAARHHLTRRLVQNKL